MATKLVHPLLAPDQMILFFPSGDEEALLDRGVPGGEGLAAVERLGGNFTRVIHPHEGSPGVPLGGRQAA